MAKHKAGAWSYSRMKNFETCPKQFYHVSVLKEHPFKETPETRYGNEFHKAAELYIGNRTPLPGKFAHYQEVLDALSARPGRKHCELKLGLTRDIEPCEYFDNRRIWFRAIIDLLIIDGDTADVVDYKTGKSARYADPDQLELMALTVMAHYPEVQKVRAGLVFVIADAMVKRTYEAEEADVRWGKWYERYAAYEKAHEEGVFNPRPSGLCRAHCPVLSCAHNGAN